MPKCARFIVSHKLAKQEEWNGQLLIGQTQCETLPQSDFSTSIWEINYDNSLNSRAQTQFTSIQGPYSIVVLVIFFLGSDIFERMQ